MRDWEAVVTNHSIGTCLFWVICTLPFETSGTASCGSMLYFKESRTFNATFVGWPGYLTNSIFSLHLLPCADERGDTRSRTSSRDAPSDEVPPFLRNGVPWSQVKSSNSMGSPRRSKTQISINDSSRSLYSFLGARNWTLHWLTKGCKWMWLLIALTYCPSAFSRF